jgi:hypothetical protein
LKVREVIELLEQMEKNGYTSVKADRNTIENTPIIYETNRYCLQHDFKFTICVEKKE